MLYALGAADQDRCSHFPFLETSPNPRKAFRWTAMTFSMSKLSLNKTQFNMLQPKCSTSNTFPTMTFIRSFTRNKLPNKNGPVLTLSGWDVKKKTVPTTHKWQQKHILSDPPHNQGCQSAPGLFYVLESGILINLHLPLSGEWIQDVLQGFRNSKRNFRHAFSILHLWKTTISSRSIVSYDIDTLDFSGQRGCHSLTCKIGHIPKKDKWASTASKHFKGYTRLYYISRKSLDTRIKPMVSKSRGCSMPQNLGAKEKKTTDIWMFPKTGVSPNHPFY